MSLHRCRFRPWRPYGAIVPYGRKPARETRRVNLGAIPAAIVGVNHRPSLLLRPHVHGTHAVPRRGQLVPPPEARRRGRVTPPIDARAGLPHVARCGLREARWALRGPSPRPASAPSRRPCRRRRRRAVLSAAARASKTAHLRGRGEEAWLASADCGWPCGLGRIRFLLPFTTPPCIARVLLRERYGVPRRVSGRRPRRVPSRMERSRVRDASCCEEDSCFVIRT